VWIQACERTAEDFAQIKALDFKHLLSAHGAPLLNKAKVAVHTSIDHSYGKVSELGLCQYVFFRLSKDLCYFNPSLGENDIPIALQNTD